MTVLQQKHVSHAMPRSTFPFVGPIASYLGCGGLAALPKELRRIYEFERRVARGELGGGRDFYAATPRDGREFLPSAGMSLIAAVGAGDEQLFDEVMADIDAFPHRCRLPHARLAAGITRTWAERFLRASGRAQKILDELDLSAVPAEWRAAVGYLVLKRMDSLGRHREGCMLADALLFLNPAAIPFGSLPDVSIKVGKSVFCREMALEDERARWCAEAVKSAKAEGVILPFLGRLLGPKTVMEEVFEREAPELLQKIRRLTPEFFRNLVRFHNRLTGESVTTALSPREFFLVRALVGGLRYKEIAMRLGVAPSRINGMTKVVYSKLGVHKSCQLKPFVW